MGRIAQHTKQMVSVQVALIAVLLLALCALALPAQVRAAEGGTGNGTKATRIYAQDGNGVTREYMVLEGDPSSYSATVVSYGGEQSNGPTWVIEARSGMPEEGGRLLSSQTLRNAGELTAHEDGLYYMPAQTIDVDGVSYHCAQKEILVNPSGGVAEAYYVADGYEPTEDYDVTLQFVDMADGTSIGSQTATVSLARAQKGADEAIAVPATLNDGAYVLIPGQFFAQTTAGDALLQHNYYAPDRTYTIYYRKASDESLADAVIAKINTVYSQPKGASEVIADEANPLAAPGLNGQDSHLGALSVKSTLFGGIMAGLFAVGGALFFFLTRKKREEDRRDFGDDV